MASTTRSQSARSSSASSGDPAQCRVSLLLGDLAAHDRLLQRAFDPGPALAIFSCAARDVADVVARPWRRPRRCRPPWCRSRPRRPAESACATSARRRSGCARRRRRPASPAPRRCRSRVRSCGREPGGDHLLQDRRRRVQPVAGLLVHRVEDLVRRVEAYQVEQRQRTHRVAAAEPHRGIDVFTRCVALLEHRDGVVEVAEQQGVGDEAGLVADRRPGPCRAFGERLHVVDDRRVGDDGPDHLDELLHGRGVEEVHADDLGGAVVATEISVTDRDEVLVARIASAASDLVELGEDLPLELEAARGPPRRRGRSRRGRPSRVKVTRSKIGLLLLFGELAALDGPVGGRLDVCRPRAASASSLRSTATTSTRCARRPRRFRRPSCRARRPRPW